MKRKVWKVLIISLILVTITAIYLGSPNSAFRKASQLKQIGKMAQYLNDKYGYDVTSDDCIYFREQDYASHFALIYRVKYDIPYIAIFDYNGEHITVTDRLGFLGDDGQLEEVSGLLTGYFEKVTGLQIENVELTTLMDNNKSINKILHQKFNEKLTDENIDRFLKQMSEHYSSIDVLLYFKAEENLESQLDKITSQLESINELGLDGSIRFYITDMEELNVQYSAPIVHLLTDNGSKSQSDEDYIWGSYQVVNEIEYSYSNKYGDNETLPDIEYNYFLAAGSYNPQGDKYHQFADRQVLKINDFDVVDLSDAALPGYAEQMEYYGTWRGYTILFKAENNGEKWVLNIRAKKLEWSFRWQNGPAEVYAFKHGRLLRLQDAYTLGYFSYDDMDEILEKHKENFESYFGMEYDDVS